MRIRNVGLLLGVLSFGLLPAVALAALAAGEEDYASAVKKYEGEDFKEAARLYRLSADQNYLPAQVRIGEFAQAAEDYEEAFGWYLVAAFQGDAAGQFNVAQMYALGLGTLASPEKAFFWTKKAAVQDYLPAMRLLRSAYLVNTDPKGGLSETQKTFGVEPNQEQADILNAKLPKLEEAEATRGRRLKAEIAKEIIARREKEKERKSKMLCGLKC